MPFTRRLVREFTDALNELYLQGTWWRKLADADAKDVFLAVRNDRLNAYAGGGSIAKVSWEGGKVHLEVHEEYLTLPSPGSSYVDLCGNAPTRSRPVIGSVDDFADSLLGIQRRAALFSGEERKGENTVASRVPIVIDMEAAFNDVSQDDNPELLGEAKTKSGRIDLVVVTPECKLVFVEAKLYSNSEIRSTTFPLVCEQLSDYHSWLKSNSTEILSAYRQLLMCYQVLHGSFFSKRRNAQPLAAVLADLGKLSVDLIPRLLIFGFDEKQKKGLLAELGPRIQEGVRTRIEGFVAAHVRAVGNASNVRDYHLA
jgi:hypothetical protein